MDDSDHVRLHLTLRHRMDLTIGIVLCLFFSPSEIVFFHHFSKIVFFFSSRTASLFRGKNVIFHLSWYTCLNLEMQIFCDRGRDRMFTIRILLGLTMLPLCSTSKPRFCLVARCKNFEKTSFYIWSTKHRLNLASDYSLIRFIRFKSPYRCRKKNWNFEFWNWTRAKKA